MAYGQVKTCWKRLRKRENENYRSDQFLPRPEIENSKNIPKKFIKLENTIRASLQAKTGWERARKRDSKNYRSNQFLLKPQ